MELIEQPLEINVVAASDISYIIVCSPINATLVIILPYTLPLLVTAKSI